MGKNEKYEAMSLILSSTQTHRELYVQLSGRNKTTIRTAVWKKQDYAMWSDLLRLRNATPNPLSNQPVFHKRQEIQREG